MADIASTIETLEHRLMRGWIQRDTRVMKKLTTRDSMIIFGAKKSLLLDRASWLDATNGRWTCQGYRLRDVFVRKHGYSIWFAAAVDLEMKLDGGDWSGSFWMTDLWKFAPFRRTHVLAERSLSRVDQDDSVAPAIRQLQLWR